MSKRRFVCQECGSAFYRYGSAEAITCGFKCRGQRIAKAKRRRSEGTRETGTRGYQFIRTYTGHPRAHKGRLVAEHVLIAERALGKYLPPGAVVHHVDENPANNANTNLVICESQGYHMTVHARQRIIKARGNPDTDKICGRRSLVKPRTEFARQGSGLAWQCKSCFNANRPPRTRKELGQI